MARKKDEIALAEAVLERHGKSWTFCGLKLRGFNNSVIREYSGEFDYGTEYGKKKLTHEQIVCATPTMKKDRSGRFMDSLKKVFGTADAKKIYNAYKLEKKVV